MVGGKGHVGGMQLHRGGVSGCKWVINGRADAAWRLKDDTPVSTQLVCHYLGVNKRLIVRVLLNECWHSDCVC